MLVRVAAAVLDAWDALRRPARAARRAWLSLPAELIARGILLGCGIPADAGRVIEGSDTAASGAPAILVEDARAARYLDRVPIRPTAQTVGRYVLARHPLPEPIVRHELEHVHQWSRLGPLFLPAYVLASAVALARGGDRYRDNRFEVAARAAEGTAPVGPAPAPKAGDAAGTPERPGPAPTSAAS